MQLKTYAITTILIFIVTACYCQTSEVVFGNYLHKGIEREYIYFSPTNLPINSPLIVALHGFTGNAETIMDYSKFNTLAKANNFAVVYPQGTKDKKSNTFWNVGYDFHADIKTDDVDFIVKLVDHLQKKYLLSAQNIFLTGMSNGGEMCYLLACRHPDIFSAIAPVAGMMLDGFFNDCDTNNTMPIFATFGTNDVITNYDGDPNNKDGWGAYQSIPYTIDFWANALNCSSVNIDTLPNKSLKDSSFILREQYLNAKTKKQVLFYKVINGGHDWPGAWGNMDINLSDDIWSFFKQYKK